METINSMASSAAKVIWGENNENNNNNNNTTTSTTTNPTASDTTTTGDTTTNETQKPLTETTANPAANTTKMSNESRTEEPVSGKLGDTSKGEPFDAGNIETSQTQTQTQTPGTETSGLTGTHEKNPTTDTTADTIGSKGPTSDKPSTTGDHGGFKAAQADIRDPESSATTDPKVEAERKNVDDTGALDKGNNPAKADGPGPKPIEEVAHERGGDAANTGENKTDANDDGPEGLGGKSEKKGTGEEYVKTSGLQADGGDFDATKPGAGREADRLMEEKGIQKPSAAAAATKTESEDTSSGSPDPKKDKASLKDKIKAKLHKN